jgi:hypothetical protein
MGNATSHHRLQEGEVHSSRVDLIKIANIHSHSIDKACRNYRNQAEVLHICCILQFQSNKRIDHENALRKKQFVVEGGAKKAFVKTPHENVCDGRIIAKALKKKDENYVKGIPIMSQAIKITIAAPHTCEGPPPSMMGG